VKFVRGEKVVLGVSKVEVFHGGPGGGFGRGKQRLALLAFTLKNADANVSSPTILKPRYTLRRHFGRRGFAQARRVLPHEELRQPSANGSHQTAQVPFWRRFDVAR